MKNFEHKLDLALGLVTESTILDKKFKFKFKNWLDPDIDISDVRKHFEEMITTDPPPGVRKYDAKVTHVGDLEDDNGFLDISMIMTLEDFVKWSFEFDNDPYIILKSVRDQIGDEAARVAHQFIKDNSHELKTTMLSLSRHDSGEEGFQADSWPSSPKF